MPSALVVVTCRNDGRTLDGALKDLSQAGVEPTNIVVLDLGSNDLYTRELLGRLRRQNVPVHNEVDDADLISTLASRTRSDYVVVMRGDGHLAPGFLATALNCLNDAPGYDFVWGMPSASWPQQASVVTLLVMGTAPSVELSRCPAWEQPAALAGPPSVALARCLHMVAAGRSGVMLSGASHAKAHVLASSDGVDAMSRLYSEHNSLIAPVARELVSAKRIQVSSLRQDLTAYLAEHGALERELDELAVSIDQLAGELQRRGLPRIDWGELRRTTPISPFWGGERGRPINRHYIEQFLRDHARDISGRVLEIKDPTYTRLFGTGVTHEDVLDIDAGNPLTTITADLRDANHIPADVYDCVILTQVLNVIDDVPAVLHHVMRILRPGGVLLCTVAAIDRVSYEDRAADGDFWRFTEASLRLHLADHCPPESTAVVCYGNVMACAAHLYGLGVHELTAAELDHRDPDFPLIVAARAVKPGRLGV